MHTFDNKIKCISIQSFFGYQTFQYVVSENGQGGPRNHAAIKFDLKQLQYRSKPSEFPIADADVIYGILYIHSKYIIHYIST